MSIRNARVITIMLLLSATAYSADNASGQSSAALGSTWATDAGKIPDLFSGTWGGAFPVGGVVDGSLGFVEHDAKLNVPFTKEAQKFADAYQHKRDIPYAQEGCTSPGLPVAMKMGGIKFTYAPGLISIYMQSTGHTRFIRMNEKQGKTSPKFYGNSVGRWEGDTLVVDTEDFVDEISFQYGVGNPLPPEDTIGTANLGPRPTVLLEALSAAIWGPHGEGMRMVERMRLVDAQSMEIKTTIYDDTVWTKPYVMTPRTYKRRLGGAPEEWVCTVSITSFDPATNTYVDKDPEEMVKFLNKQQGK